MAECSHQKMRMIGDLVFECEDCRHTEIGCSHSRTTKINGRLTCLICQLELDPITLDPMEKPKTVPRPQPLTVEEISKLLGEELARDLKDMAELYEYNNCQHRFNRFDYDNPNDDRFICYKCGRIRRFH